MVNITIDPSPKRIIEDHPHPFCQTPTVDLSIFPRNGSKTAKKNIDDG